MKFTTERIIPDRLECGPTLQTHMARYRFVESFVQDAVALDAGCGCGYGTHHLAKSGARNVTGIDVSPQAIEYARQHYSAANLRYRVMDVAALSFPDETFDAAVCLEVFEHVPDYRQLLAEIRRVLKPNGRIVVSTPNGRIFSPKGRPINPWHVHEFSRIEFQKVMAPYFREVQLWGQTIKSPIALPATIFHLRMQRYISTRDSWASRLVEIGYRGVRKAAMLPARFAVTAMSRNPNRILKAEEIPDRRTWYFIAVGRKRLDVD